MMPHTLRYFGGAALSTLLSCQPIPNLLNFSQTRAAKCENFNADVMDYLLDTPTLKTIILHATWGSIFQALTQ